LNKSVIIIGSDFGGVVTVGLVDFDLTLEGDCKFIVGLGILLDDKLELGLEGVVDKLVFEEGIVVKSS
jgi:hypothetical protein